MTQDLPDEDVSMDRRSQAGSRRCTRTARASSDCGTGGAETIFGYRREDALGRTLDLIIPRAMACAGTGRVIARSCGLASPDTGARYWVPASRSDGESFYAVVDCAGRCSLLRATRVMLSPTEPRHNQNTA